MRIAREEIFGPVAALIPFDTVDEAVRIANDSVFGLAASLWTRDLTTALSLSRAVQAGVVWVNCFGEGDMTMPWGGYKQSGNGRESNVDALLEYTQTKSIRIKL
jgi:gamma-glutamyl-gamma-aminobutyraldehyde dehydrogenase